MSNTENSYSETDLGNVSPNPRGEYDPETSYEYLDLVNYKGGSYLCLAELETTVTGVAPAHGKNTDTWQLLTLSGDLTPEYIAMHDDVANKAKQVEDSRAAVEQSQEEIEASQADVQQLHSDTVEAAQKASDSRDSAAGYAQAAETSRQAAAESEQNVNAQTTGFDTHVSESVTQAQEEIAATRQQAIRAVASQQVTSTQAVKDQTASYIAEKEASAKTEIGNYTSEKVAEINNKASEANITLANTIAAGTSLKTQLETTISTADTSKKNLDASDTAAGKTKTALDISNTTATKTKADLDASNTTASEAKTELDATNKTAADLVVSLRDKITEGTRVKTDIQTTGETAMSNLQAEATKQQEYIKTSIDDTLSISGKAADAAVTGKKMDSLKEDLSNKITKFYASNQGETHITDSDNGKIQDMMLYGKSEQNQYKGINLLPTGISYGEMIEVSIPKGTRIFWATDGTPAIGGNFKFYNEDKTQKMWFGIDSGKTTMTRTTDIDAKYMEFLIDKSYSAKICLGIGDNPVYEPYTGGQPSPSPDYPQEIKSVVNPMIKVCGVNLFDQTKVFKNIDIGTRSIVGINCYNIVGNGQSTDRRYYLIECKPNTKYYITFVNSNNNIFIGVADKNYIGIKDVSVFENITSRTFTTGNNVKFIVLNADGTSNICISEDNATFEPYHEQTIQLPYTLNAIPVASGGNVTIDGQQYIADRVVEKDGVFGIERNIREIHTNTKTMNNTEEYPGWNKVEGISDTTYYNEQSVGASKILTFISNFTQTTLCQNNIEPNNIVFLIKDLIGYSQSDLIAKAIDMDMYIRLQNAIFEPLPVGMQAKLRTLVTNYPVTNISVNSEQLDGYTVFNYPISMANGWNYVKQQLNDNRDYIYDMDLQSAEAYVNSEYAVALTELEV